MSIPVHSLILSSSLFFCLPFLLFPFTMPCRIVFAKPEDLETWPNHLCFRVRRLTIVRSSLYSPVAAWIFQRTSSMTGGPCTKCSISFGSISSQRLRSLLSIYYYRTLHALRQVIYFALASCYTTIFAKNLPEGVNCYLFIYH